MLDYEWSLKGGLNECLLQALVEKTSFAAVFLPLFAAILAPINSDSSKCPTLNAAVQNRK